MSLKSHEMCFYVLISYFICVNACVSRLSKYLAQNERDNERRSFERFGQFDVGYHNISFDDECQEQ